MKELRIFFTIIGTFLVADLAVVGFGLQDNILVKSAMMGAVLYLVRWLMRKEKEYRESKNVS